MQYASTNKDSSNYLFCHIWFFKISRKAFLRSTAPLSLKSPKRMPENAKNQVKLFEEVVWVRRVIFFTFLYFFFFLSFFWLCFVLGVLASLRFLFCFIFVLFFVFLVRLFICSCGFFMLCKLHLKAQSCATFCFCIIFL